MKIVLRATRGPNRVREFELRGHDTFVVGRSGTAGVRLPIVDEGVSRVHFLIEMNPPSCRLVGIASTNGTEAGATSDFLLTGRIALDFSGACGRSSRSCSATRNPSPFVIRDRPPEAPSALAEAAHRSLQPDPAERFPDARTMHAALKPFPG